MGKSCYNLDELDKTNQGRKYMKNKPLNLLLAGALCLSLTAFTTQPVQAQTTADISTHATSTNDSTTEGNTNSATDSVVTVEDGEYTVDAKFLKEGSTTETSMANLALNSASLKVENGKITVFLNMQEMEMYGMKATVDEISYQNIDGTWQKADITQSENNIPTQFAFILPENKSYTDIQFFYLGHSAKARLYLDLANIVEVITVDKTDLKTLIDQVKTYHQEDYTSTSFQALETALNTASTVYSNENATQDEIDEQVELLNKAISQLSKKPVSGIELLNEDGVYQLPVHLWNATADKASMADSALVEKAIIKVENGKKTITIYTQKMTMGTIEAYLQELKLVNSDGTYTNVEANTRDSQGNPTSFTFELPHTEEYIDVMVNPHVALMGNQDIAARLKLDYSQLTVYLEDTSNNNTTVEKPTTENTNTQTQDKQEESQVQTPQKTNNVVQTGDETKAGLMGGLLITSLFLGFFVSRKRRCE